MISFDTNILLYAADVRDARKQRIAMQTLRSAQDGVLLWHAACEFIAASRKLLDYGLTAIEAWGILAEYLRTFRLVLPSAAVLERRQTLTAQSNEPAP